MVSPEAVRSAFESAPVDAGATGVLRREPPRVERSARTGAAIFGASLRISTDASPASFTG